MREEYKAQIKYLEERRKNCHTVILFLFILLIFISATCIVYIVKFVDKQDKLEECQENIGTWTLKVYCEYDKTKATFEIGFDSYEEYELNLKDMVEDEDCEVIE